MKILFVSRCPPAPIEWGDRLILHHVGRELARRGHTLDLLALDERPDLGFQPGDDPHFRHVQVFPDPARRPVDYVSRWLIPARRFPTHAAAAWSPALWTAIRDRLAAERYDVIHAIGGVQVYEYVRAYGGVPAVITPYESFTLYLRRQPEIGARLRGIIAAGYERFMFAPYQAVTVLAEPDAVALRRLAPALPVQVIPNGVDLAGFAPPPDMPRSAAELVFVGNFSYPPNVDAAIRLVRDVLPTVRMAIPAAGVTLVGTTPPPEVVALAGDGVTVTGRVPDVRPYLARAAAFVCPLTQGAGIKNKVLEALAAAAPVVLTPLSADGLHLIDGLHARIAPVDALAAAVIAVLRDPAGAGRMGAAGRDHAAARFSWAAVAAQYEALYQDAAASVG